MRIASILAVTLMIVGCTGGSGIVGSGPVVGGDRVTSAYAMGRGAWSDGAEIVIRATVKPHGQGTAICGTWSVSQSSVHTSPYHEDVIGSARVDLNGQTVAQNLRFMNKSNAAGDLDGASATCVATNAPLGAGNVEVVIPAYRITVPSGGSGKSTYKFRQST